MKVTAAQAQANRETIVATASGLFRERGYDGVGIAELMGASGFTHGGFYKHFTSKVALMAESTAWGFGRVSARLSKLSPEELIDRYVSRAHRDSRGDGCILTSLGGDAPRQPDDVKAVFAAGIEDMVALFEGGVGSGGDSESRERAISRLALAVGAIALSRACPDESPLADEILHACRGFSRKC